MTTRTCKVCGEPKPLDRYHFQSQVKGGKRYFVHQCLDCYNAMRRQLYQSDSVYRHKCDMRVARWQAQHPEYMRDYHRTYQRKVKRHDTNL